jgi:hypothetical protein
LLVADTRFDGFDFSDYRRSLSEADWTIDGVAIHDDQQIPLKRETTYSKAKAGAARQGDTLAESKFLIKERRFRRARYQADINSADTYTAKAKTSLNLATNYLYDLTCEYGENPRRVLALSLGSIVYFAALYWLLDVGIPTPSTVTLGFAPRAAVEYLTFSLQAFTAFFIPGDFSPDSQSLRLLSALQSFIGAFTIALFVATIVRTVER